MIRFRVVMLALAVFTGAAVTCVGQAVQGVSPGNAVEGVSLPHPSGRFSRWLELNTGILGARTPCEWEYFIPRACKRESLLDAAIDRSCREQMPWPQFDDGPRRQCLAVFNGAPLEDAVFTARKVQGA